jgi:hypothetical protein
MRWIALLSSLLLATALGLGCGSSESDLPDVSAGIEEAAEATADAVEGAAEAAADEIEGAAEAVEDEIED